MMRSPWLRTTANLSNPVHHQLNMYVLAAGAAGVGTLALAQPAEAKIVYTASNVTIGYGGMQAYHLDLNHDGIADFSIFTIRRSYNCGLRGRRTFGLFEKAAAGNGAITKGKPTLAAALPAGVPIGPARRFFGGTETMAYRREGYGGGCQTHELRGLWGDNWRYLGLSFKISGRTHYGWARLFVTSKFPEGFTAYLTGYAYETVPGKAIVAGKTYGEDDAWEEDEFSPDASLASPVPDTLQPASLGMLALGARVVPMWRRKEEIATAQ